MSGAAPQWNDLLGVHTSNMIVSVQPVGWIGDWHETPKPQWIIPLSGRWFVETMDGTRVEMGPGELSFGEDQNCKERDGKKGHRSGVVGDEPADPFSRSAGEGALRSGADEGGRASLDLAFGWWWNWILPVESPSSVTLRVTPSPVEREKGAA